MPSPQPLPGASPLADHGDLAAAMVSGIHAFLERAIARSVEHRSTHWRRDFSSHGRYSQSVEPNRQRLLQRIGAVDARDPVCLEIVGTGLPSGEPGLVCEGAGFRAYTARWNVFDGIEGEGLLLQPDRPPVADVVALPDCDWTPEMLVGLAPGVPRDAHFARRLAESGCRVLVPQLIDRRCDYSVICGSATNQPHREFIYRAAYGLGRHIIGYEVQKVFAAVDWFVLEAGRLGSRASARPIGVAGYGEGGLIAFYAAAADPRIDAALVSGYFQPRESVWQEPIYRNVFGLLHEFGDAEIASLVAPRPLVVEACRQPESASPAQEPEGEAAPGFLTTPPAAAMRAEVVRARALTAGLAPAAEITLIEHDEAPGTPAALQAFLHALGSPDLLTAPGEPPKPAVPLRVEERRKRQFRQLAEHTQLLIRKAAGQRRAFWTRADFSSPSVLSGSISWYRNFYWDEIIGRLPAPDIPPNPRSREIYETAGVRGYEVTLDVYPGVFAYGILVLPKDLRPGERRPVVVTQHGLEGRPRDVADPTIYESGCRQYGLRLAEQGFVVFAPQNPYIGDQRFRQIMRKAHPLKLTLFSFIARQHERILEWLQGLPFVDGQRIGFYGISYGGFTAMRIPALLPGYCLSICSANYNEWVWKVCELHSKYSYVRTAEYDIPEFDFADRFNYAELSWLICPRPFMVERGHDDGVAPDEWVAYEYARTRAAYDRMGLGARTEMEVFNDGHVIHGVGTFDFLHRHLGSPHEAS